MESSRQEYWSVLPFPCVAISFSRRPSRPRDWTWSPTLAGVFLTTEPPEKAYITIIYYNYSTYNNIDIIIVLPTLWDLQLYSLSIRNMVLILNTFLYLINIFIGNQSLTVSYNFSLIQISFIHKNSSMSWVTFHMGALTLWLASDNPQLTSLFSNAFFFFLKF